MSAADRDFFEEVLGTIACLKRALAHLEVAFEQRFGLVAEQAPKELDDQPSLTVIAGGLDA